jgi:hypothetical protein
VYKGGTFIKNGDKKLKKVCVSAEAVTQYRA